MQLDYILRGHGARLASELIGRFEERNDE